MTPIGRTFFVVVALLSVAQLIVTYELSPDLPSWYGAWPSAHVHTESLVIAAIRGQIMAVLLPPALIEI